MKASTKNLGIIRSITKAMLCVGISVLVWPLVVRSQGGPETAPISASRWDPSKLGALLLRDPPFCGLVYFASNERHASGESRNGPRGTEEK